MALAEPALELPAVACAGDGDDVEIQVLRRIGGVLQDNFPLGVAAPDHSISDHVANNQNGVCTIAQWRGGHCVSPPTTFDIPFAELGEFVYHCHILEHEDGGMMARVKGWCPPPSEPAF